ncbi:phosphatidylinositol 3 and 4-kinase-domain-containing protein [Suillus bovinus]|uniref:phosphatidylinositol 3 and 4-kinase-domain-containing protein n=1 Tax=Suillus bovinus TaxID=48563 RepID=UPI001B882459|nr:phosphatidylinositol 3 and 4-kinase-domain-containing protein [Suillus bovinus]KAG2154403.1 phosphatidylinositol 3 and 4-kinase-domain-containing protein [Suillus bovinus]
MPHPAGYQQLPQGVEDEIIVEEQDTEDHAKAARGRSARVHKPGHIDLRKLDNAFKRWTESIAQKVKRKKKVEDYSRKEIWQSVFEPCAPPFAVGSGSEFMVKTLDHKPPMSQATFDNLAQSVRNAISAGIHPKMIVKGSSGSYFARAKVDGRVQTVAVFKPKDEEPYGRLNPKTTKWLHRQFRWIIPFGRACLIPNLSYISEAAGSLLDERLGLNIVPRTQLVSLSSPAFFYDWIDRSAAKKGKQLPEKIGSMQYFLHGYTDASDFLRKHPWPGRSIADTFDDSSHRKGLPTKRFLSALKIICGRTGDEDIDNEDPEEERALFDVTEDNESGRPFYWSRALQQSFREELEKLVILDYLMLNTDRGADNYMIKYCEGSHEKLVDIAPQPSAHPQMPQMRRAQTHSPSSQSTVTFVNAIPPSQANAASSDYMRQPHIHIAAIDNSLSFPHEHPRGWRSYTYGWLYLPVNLIGRPFSAKTRAHFLPLLTSKTWWEETTFQLRNLFAVDPDFHPKMFQRQLAVIKGQAYNIIESLKHADEGPLELTRRTKALVWDDEIEIMEEAPRPPGPSPASPRPSISTMPLPRRTRSQSHSAEFPPPVRRRSSEADRPVPFSAKFQKVHPGTTGVTVLEHLERLDVVEAGLQRLGVEEPVIEEDEEEEVDVGMSSAPQPLLIPTVDALPIDDLSASQQLTPPGSPGGLTSVPDVHSLANSVTEEDLAVMSKSMSHVESPFAPQHNRWNSHAGRMYHQPDRSLDWMNVDELEQQKRTVIVERFETVAAKPLLSCW